MKGPTALLASLLIWTAACQRAPEPAQANPASWRLIDLSYTFDSKTLYWPTDGPFRHEQVAFGRTAKGYFYSSFRYGANEHGGTHLDAPIHFGEGKPAVADLPLDKLFGPAVVIDVREICAGKPDTLVSAADLQAAEAATGPVPEGAAVLIWTGWGQYWPDAKQYLGSDKPGDASDLHFPGLAKDAAELLAQRKVRLIGIDTASIDPGNSQDFPVHQVMAAAEIPGLENVANLEKMPARGAWLLAAPMKIGGGSGAPCRIVGLVAP